jgi:drug/metabolite transporter (DMT)-like permease
VTAFSFLFVLIAEICAVTGQVFFKHAMGGAKGGMARNLTLGITVMAVNFFLWTGLLSKFPVSYLYPFDGLNRVVMMFAASIFLKEKMTLNLWMGVALICAGVLLVSRS